MRRLRWKLDLTILPMFLITQALQFMDKTSLNYANLFGYQTTLHLKGQQFNYLSASTRHDSHRWPILGYMYAMCAPVHFTDFGTVVYAGYFFGQYPCGWLIGRFPAQKVLAISIFLWGLMVIIMTQCRSYSTARTYLFPASGDGESSG